MVMALYHSNRKRANRGTRGFAAVVDLSTLFAEDCGRACNFELEKPLNVSSLTGCFVGSWKMRVGEIFK